MDSMIDIKKLRDNRVLANAGKMIAQSFANFVGLKRITFGNKEEEVMASFLNKTGREEAKEMIKRGVEDNLFFDKHENVDEYDDIQLLSYALAYVNRKLKTS